MLTRSKPVGTEIALTQVTLQTRETESEIPLTNRVLRTSIGSYKNLEITSTTSTGRSLKEGDIFTRVQNKVKLGYVKERYIFQFFFSFSKFIIYAFLSVLGYNQGQNIEMSTCGMLHHFSGIRMLLHYFLVTAARDVMCDRSPKYRS